MPTRYLNINTHDVSLSYLYEVLRTKLDESTATQLISNYCFRCNSKDIQKKGLEFLYMYGFKEELQLLIEKNIQSKDPDIRQWGEAYRLFLDYNEGKKPPKELLQQINQLTPAEPELYCFVEMLKIQVYIKMYYYDPVDKFINVADELFLSIEDHLLLRFFQIRYRQILFTYNLTRNEVIIARKTAYEILNETKNPNIIVDTHMKLGLSYTFESYFLGMYHLKEALNVAKKHELLSQAEKTENLYIPFLAAHFCKPENIKTTDLGEQAHLEIAKGNVKTAINILQKVPITNPFHTYYLGKAKKDKVLLLTAYKNFIHDRSDYFFSRLPLKELRKLDGFSMSW